MNQQKQKIDELEAWLNQHDVVDKDTMMQSPAEPIFVIPKNLRKVKVDDELDLSEKPNSRVLDELKSFIEISRKLSFKTIKIVRQPAFDKPDQQSLRKKVLGWLLQQMELGLLHFEDVTPRNGEKSSIIIWI